MSDQDLPIPPATFDFLILSLKAQAEVHLGLIYFGDGKDRPRPDFRIARHTLDMLAMLQEKTRGRVTLEEQRLVVKALSGLRLRLAHAIERQQKHPAAAPPHLSDN